MTIVRRGRKTRTLMKRSSRNLRITFKKTYDEFSSSPQTFINPAMTLHTTNDFPFESLFYLLSPFT